MTGDIKLNRAEIQQGWREVLFTQIFYSARFFYFTGNGRPVVSGNVKLFDKQFSFTLTVQS